MENYDMGRCSRSLIKKNENIAPKGLVEIFVTRGAPKHLLTGRIENKYGLPLCTDHRLDFTDCELLNVSRVHNIILNQGKDSVITGLTSYTGLFLARLAVGDRGTIPSDAAVPKTPTGDMTGLYNEVYRSDAEAIVRNTGGSIHEVRLVKTFSAVDINITAFSNQAKPVINEVCLVMIDPAALPMPRSPVQGPYNYPLALPYPYPPISPYNYPPPDEVVFSIRTFRSVPFEASTGTSITIRYTIYIE